MKIIVDGFGGDNAPLAVLQGCELAVKEYGVDLIVTGDEEILKKTAGTDYLLPRPRYHRHGGRAHCAAEGKIRLFHGGGF